MTINGKKTIKEALFCAVDFLSQDESISTPRLDCEILMSGLLNCSRIDLILKGDTLLDFDVQKAFFDMVERRKHHEPVSYITAKKEFMSLDFWVSPGVLIPRPETEFLVEYIVGKFKPHKSPMILDLCTGSGAIAVSVAYFLKNATVTAMDKYEICVSAAKKNAEANSVAERVQVVQADIFRPIPIENKVQCIVSNPPYIRRSVLSSLPDDVAKYEPEYALDGGDDGLIFYRRITELAKEKLENGGLLVFEIGFDQAEEVSEILKESNMFQHIEITKDYAGLNRMITAEKKGLL